MEFIVGGIIAVGIIYCFLKVLPDTIKEVYKIVCEIINDYRSRKNEMD